MKLKLAEDPEVCIFWIWYQKAKNGSRLFYMDWYPHLEKSWGICGVLAILFNFVFKSPNL